MHLRKRRILDDVVRGEDDQLSQVLRDVEPCGGFAEKPLAPCFAYVFELFFAIETSASCRKRCRVDIRRENLQIEWTPVSRHLLVKQHRKGISFFSGCAARDPDANLFGLGNTVQNLGDDLLFEKLESVGISEEARDTDGK